MKANTARLAAASCLALAALGSLAATVALAGAPPQVGGAGDELRLVSVVVRTAPPPEPGQPPAPPGRIVDVAVSRRGAIYALYSGGVIEKYQGGRRVATIRGSAVPQSRGYGDGPGLAIGPSERIYVFDRRLNAIAVLDNAGGLVRRATVPHRFEPFYSFDVDAQGRVYFGAFTDDAPEGQVHLLCARIDCYVRSAGEPRRTEDPEAARFFQSGFVSVAGNRVLFAGLNPFRLERYDLELRNGQTVTKSDVLADGERIAYQKSPDGSRRISNAFPQTTGVAQLPDGRILHTAFIADQARSILQVFTAAGRLEGSSEILGHARVEGVLPNGDVVLLRSAGQQEIAIYRYTDSET
jgi:hypothetical protein